MNFVVYCSFNEHFQNILCKRRLTSSSARRVTINGNQQNNQGRFQDQPDVIPNGNQRREEPRMVSDETNSKELDRKSIRIHL